MNTTPNTLDHYEHARAAKRGPYGLGLGGTFIGRPLRDFIRVSQDQLVSDEEGTRYGATLADFRDLVADVMGTISQGAAGPGTHFTDPDNSNNIIDGDDFDDHREMLELAYLTGVSPVEHADYVCTQTQPAAIGLMSFMRQCLEKGPRGVLPPLDFPTVEYCGPGSLDFAGEGMTAEERRFDATALRAKMAGGNPLAALMRELGLDPDDFDDDDE